MSTGRHQRSIDVSCGKLDVEGGASTRITVDPDFPSVVGDYGLDDRQAKASAMLFCRVVRGEQPLSFLVAQSLACIGHVDPDNAAVLASNDAKRATLRHRVDRIEEQVLNDTPQLLTIASDSAERGVEVERQRDGWMPGRGELRAE